MKKLIITLMLLALSISGLFVGIILVTAIYTAKIFGFKGPQKTLDRCVLFSQNATKWLEDIGNNSQTENGNPT